MTTVDAAPPIKRPPAPAIMPGGPGGGGAMTPAANAISLAAEHFAAAMLFLLAGAAGLVWIAPDLAAGTFLSPHVAGITHLFTLGWITTTIFGALCQLLPVALGAPLRSVRAAHASFWTFAPGVALFAIGVAGSSIVVHDIGISLVAIGIVIAVTNIALSLARARMRDATWAAVILAICFLSSTLLFGIVLLHNLDTGFIAAWRVHVLASHLHVAIVGWAVIMMAGVSYRLLPMFLLAHGADTRWIRAALPLLATGVVALPLGLLTGSTIIQWLGAVLLEAGLVCFLRQAIAFHRVRVRKVLDVGMRFAATGLAFLAVSAVLGPIVLARGIGHGHLAVAYVMSGLLGGVVLFIAGFFYKIVPLLAWTARYRNKMGKGKVPTVAETYSARVAVVQYWLMAPGIALLVIGAGTALPIAARVGAVLLLAGVVLFAGQMARLVLGGRS